MSRNLTLGPAWRSGRSACTWGHKWWLRVPPDPGPSLGLPRQGKTADLPELTMLPRFVPSPHWPSDSLGRLPLSPSPRHRYEHCGSSRGGDGAGLDVVERGCDTSVPQSRLPTQLLAGIPAHAWWPWHTPRRSPGHCPQWEATHWGPDRPGTWPASPSGLWAPCGPQLEGA